MRDTAGEYRVEERQLKPQHTLTVRVTAAPAELPELLGAIFAEVVNCAQARQVEVAGPPFLRSHSFETAQVDIEAGVPVARAVEGEGRVRASELPGGRVATTWHTGPYESIGPAYESIQAWMNEAKAAPAGAPWEVYWTDPGQEPDPSNWRTEVLWPVT